LIGVYLLKSGKGVIQVAFNDPNEENEDSISSLFILFMKLTGLALIIYSLPKAFQLISNILFVSSVHIVGTGDRLEFILHNLVTTVISLLLGVYLLRSGKIFYRLGFAKQNDENDKIE